jgi:hypothetical protein
MKRFLVLLGAVLIVLFVDLVFAGQATLSWDPPTTNADGTPLTDLGGYKIYRGTSSGNYTETTDIGMGTCAPPNCTYVVTNLNGGLNYYFVATAYDTSLNESGYSNEVFKYVDSKSAVYRFWSAQYTAHFFTIDQAEKDYIISHYPTAVWQYEQIAFKACTIQESQSMPVYRFWSDTYKAHFFTIDQTEKDYIISHYPATVWRYEKIAFYAFKAQIANTMPVYRFWSDQNKAHFYTISSAEKDYIVSHYKSSEWSYEGIKFYAYPF